MSTEPEEISIPPGGPSTIGGVIYQMLWCLLRLTQYEVRRLHLSESGEIGGATLVLEPTGGGGDARELRGSKYVVTQLKLRSGGGTWSLQEVIKDVLPDLHKAVKLDASEPLYQFITNGKRGAWSQVERFFRKLRTQEPGNNPSEKLDNSNAMKVGARLPTTSGPETSFWNKDSYTERELFAKIVDSVGGNIYGSERLKLEHSIWHLLGHFEFGAPLSATAAQDAIDLALSEVAEKIEDVPKLRDALLLRLANLARKGNAEIKLESFLKGEGLKAIPRGHISELQARSREVVCERVRRCGFDLAQHVQEAFTEQMAGIVQACAIVAIVGPSGSGKSWHSYAIADALSRQGALVAHVEVAGNARHTLDVAMGVLWNTVKCQDEMLPFDRAAKGLPGPPPTRVLVVDQVDDPAVGRELALSGLEALGIRLVMACSPQAIEGFRFLDTIPCQVIEVPPFTPSQLSDYLQSRQIRQSESIPADVRDVLTQPMLARMFCDLAEEPGWRPKNEYELFSHYWKVRIHRNPGIVPILDLSLLRDLTRSLLEGELYPWRPGLLNEKLKHEKSLARLQKAGLLVVHESGVCSLWHDRLLNWLLADTLVEDYLSGRRSAGDLAKTILESYDGTLIAGGRWMGYVAMDAMWLLAERRAPSAVFAEMLASLEQSVHSHGLYKNSVRTLGEMAISGLLLRLEQLLKEPLTHQAVEIVSCLSELATPEAVAKARTLLMAETTEHQTLALQILSRQGDPASLDRLWWLHEQAAASQHRFVNYELRLKAMDAAISLQPKWLEAKLIASTSDTANIAELVYMLARVPNGQEMWRTLKAHLKQIVPEDKRRCLVRCIMVFRDDSEIEFLRAERNREVDMIGDTAMAALARLTPDTAIKDLSVSELRYLAITRNWHFHRLLAAKPTETQQAVRALVASSPSRAQALYSDAENEIDVASFEQVLDWLEATLGDELAGEKADPNAGAVFMALSFIERVCRPDLLSRLVARLGTSLEKQLFDYLTSIGPRDDIGARLCDEKAFQTLEYMGSEMLSNIVASGLDAPSWFGRLDAAKEAHKHADFVVINKLKIMVEAKESDDNDKFVSYMACHALCQLEEWDTLLSVVIRAGLAISPYLAQHRVGQPAISGAHVESILQRILSRERSPGIFLAAGLTRDSRFVSPITEAFVSGALSRDETLAAALALDVLEADTPSFVAGLVRHLGDDTLRDRFLRILLRVNTREALNAVVESISIRFDPEVCALLARQDGYLKQAAELAWNNRDTAERSLFYAVVVPLFGHIEAAACKEYLERLAVGIGRSLFGTSLRVAAIQGLAHRDSEAAFNSAQASLRDRSCNEREQMPALLMQLDAQRALAVLREAIRTVKDEGLELSIADALSSADLDADLTAMLNSEEQEIRRVACVIAGRRANTSPAIRELLRAKVLDSDERVAAAAVRSLRDLTRADAVAVLVDSATQCGEKCRRWIILERIAKHSRGRKELPPVVHAVLRPLAPTLSPLEAKRFSEEMKKGDEEYKRAIKERAERRPASD